ncbi:hypothetical protein PISL3812_09755 [Talaromyces islandicus]|uniref:Protein kinase domain-containing protein n=1 Tax=Talaromyces islandicus TaxID=28573 RepID=A0A0U1MCG5_TALIS|nr:hypothetical protein PISL3812_09755 [Talaromyces islandicus]
MAPLPLPTWVEYVTEYKPSQVGENEAQRHGRGIHEQPFSEAVDGFPEPQQDSILVKFSSVTQECCGMEIGNISRRPTFVKEEVLVPSTEYKAVQTTNHRNIVNLKGVSVIENRLCLSYEQTGLTLKQFQEFTQFDRNAVATICREIIHGLLYIHDELKISHGELNCSNVHINEDGEVQIGNIGKSMMQMGNESGIAQDIQAVYDIAADLLNLEGSSDKNSMSFLMADHFTKLSPNIQLQDLLKHPFFNISQGPWYLSYLGMMRSLCVSEGSESG